MSRIGKKPVPLVKGVSASISGQTVEVKGPKGTRTFTAGDDVTLTIENNAVKVTPRRVRNRLRRGPTSARTSGIAGASSTKPRSAHFCGGDRS